MIAESSTKTNQTTSQASSRVCRDRTCQLYFVYSYELCSLCRGGTLVFTVDLAVHVLRWIAASTLEQGDLMDVQQDVVLALRNCLSCRWPGY